MTIHSEDTVTGIGDEELLRQRAIEQQRREMAYTQVSGGGGLGIAPGGVFYQPYSDAQLRQAALASAIQYAVGRDSSSEQIVKDAQAFLDFLKGIRADVE